MHSNNVILQSIMVVQNIKRSVILSKMTIFMIDDASTDWVIYMPTFPSHRRCGHKIFILGVEGFPKMTQTYPKRFPKKISKDVPMISTDISNIPQYSVPRCVLPKKKPCQSFPLKIGELGEVYYHYFTFIWLFFLLLVSVNILFLKQCQLRLK